MPALLAAAIAIRAWNIGDPVLDLDEQWYLLVGDRMLHGALPFVDLWDRKPIGLFLIFAAIRVLPGDGVVAYQVVATLFAGATAATICAAARRVGASLAGSVAAGLLYLLTISVIGGQGGQSPVFYNLPVALAALLTLRLPALSTGDAGATGGAIVRRGIGACALVGLAIQIKYTAAFEGVFVGLAHLAALHRVTRSRARIAIAAVCLALAGLLPTLIALASYRAIAPGALNAFLFANFLSITLRHSYPAAQVARNLGSILAQIAPLLLATLVALWQARPWRRGGTAQALAWWWLVAAVAGFACIGTFHDHYALPLIAPLAVVASPALGQVRRLRTPVLLAAVGLLVGEQVSMPRDARTIRTVAALMHDRSGGACPYVFMGDPILYHLSRSCIPTAYAFPNTLAQAIEQGSTGIDEAAEVARIMRCAPPVVVTSDRRRTIWNRDSLLVMQDALRRDYRLTGRYPRSRWHLLVYERRQATTRRCPAAA